MPSLRDEITNTIRRLRGRTPAGKPDLDETVVASDPRELRDYGNYRILRRLGVGGMGHVYLAIDTHLGRHAALKFLSPKLKSNPEMLARLQQEARTASSLNHPNILTIYDISEAEGEPFIASEFVDGVTLRQALERGAVDPASALEIAIQIASALIPAHEAGVIHRDLKPGNVMLRPDGLVKVIDFGLAKFTARGHVAPVYEPVVYEPVSDPGLVVGTVQYMSPEQARGDQLDARTDLWSLGVMLYEMVSRTKPFDGETESHVIVAILDHRPPELKTGAGVPAGLARVVEKALAKNPDKRYQTAQEMLSALKALDTWSKSSRVSVAALAKKRRQRRWRWVVALVCAAVCALPIWWWPFEGREAVLGPDWFVPSHWKYVTHRGDVEMASISPDGKKIAYLTKNGAENQLHLLHLDTNAEWVWPPYTGDTKGFTFSPDSGTLYYTVHDQSEWGRLYSARENSPNYSSVLDDVDGPIAFSPDGAKFAFHRRSDDKRTNRESILVVNTADTGDQRIILSKVNTFVGTRVAWSSGGTLAVNVGKQTLAHDTQPTVDLYTADGKQLGEYTDARLRRLSGPAWLDARSLMIFSGFGRGSDEAGSGVVELAPRSGQFRFFSSPTLVSSSMTVSGDFQQVAAISSKRKSTLWVADAGALNAPQKWSDEDSFDSFTWSSDDSIIHPSPRGGDVALWETSGAGASRKLPQPADCMSRQPATVPGKRMLIFSSNCQAAANASNLWILDLANGTRRQLTEHSSSDEWPVVGPDGDTVLYNSWATNFPFVVKISLRTRVESQFNTVQARNPVISPDSQSFVCQIRENYDGRWRQALLSVSDGAIQKDNLPLPADNGSLVRWSPDGSALDYVDPHDSANIWRLPLSGSAPRPLTHFQGAAISDFKWSRNGRRLAWLSSDVRRDVIIFSRGASK